MHTCPQRERETERDYCQSSFMISNMIEFACNCEHNLQDKKIPQAEKKKTSSAYFMNESKNNKVLFLENSGHKRR
jgi:hypothetical protein